MRIVKQGMRYLLGALFMYTGVLHFVKSGFFTNIMPGYIPLHLELVYLTGVTEFVAGAMLFYGPTVRLGAWGIVAMLVIFFAVHIHMLVHADRYADVPVWGLWLRILLQFPLIAWAWWFTRPTKPVSKGASA